MESVLVDVVFHLLLVAGKSTSYSTSQSKHGRTDQDKGAGFWNVGRRQDLRIIEGKVLDEEAVVGRVSAEGKGLNERTSFGPFAEGAVKDVRGVEVRSIERDARGRACRVYVGGREQASVGVIEIVRTICISSVLYETTITACIDEVFKTVTGARTVREGDRFQQGSGGGIQVGLVGAAVVTDPEVCSVVRDGGERRRAGDRKGGSNGGLGAEVVAVDMVVISVGVVHCRSDDDDSTTIEAAEVGESIRYDTGSLIDLEDVRSAAGGVVAIDEVIRESRSADRDEEATKDYQFLQGTPLNRVGLDRFPVFKVIDGGLVRRGHQSTRLMSIGG